jgi:thiamine pyrophosphate-dependent acetolactate synthase large subunit-like protein
LVDLGEIPFVTSPMGKGYLPDHHPRCYCSVRAAVLSTADVVLCVGARLNWTFRFGAEFAPDAKLIHVDIHEAEIGKHVQPAVGIVGDAKQVLGQLLAQLELPQWERSGSREFRDWLDQLDRLRRERANRLASSMQDDRLPMSPQRLVREIREFAPRDTLFVIDGNVILGAAQQGLPSYLPASRLTPGTNGCLGVGVPFAVGAKLALPERPVLALCGDTALGFSAMEMETAVRYRVPVVIVVANNEGNNGSLRQKAFYPEDYPDRVATFPPGIHYEFIMSAFGAHAEYVEEPEQVKPALERAFGSGTAACINVKVDPHAPYLGQ